MIELIALLLGLILAFIHYFTDRLHLKYYLHKNKLISFAAGISIAFIFLEMFPELFKGAEYLHNFSVLFVLIGFSVVHIIEKHIYSHYSEKKRKREVEGVHAAAFFVYHLVIGMILAILIQEDIIIGLLFFFPLIFHITISSVSLNEMEKVHRKIFVKVFLSISTLLGILFALTIPISLLLYHSLTGLIVGVFLYIVIRDLIPKEREGNILFFVVGVLTYTFPILLTWML